VDAAWRPALDALLDCLESTDVRQLQRFFWPDWGRADRDVPERIAYLVAARAMEPLLDAHPIDAIVRWPAEQALREVRVALEALR
jgi:hypothetical protein